MGKVVQMMPKANVAGGLGPDGICPLNLSHAKSVELFQTYLENPNTCIVVHTDKNEKPAGFLLGVIFVHPFNDAIRLSKDVGWYIEEDARGRLSIANQMLALYEDWACSMGCQFAGMAGMGKDPKVGVLYERRGYSAIETHYIKRLT